MDGSIVEVASRGIIWAGHIFLGALFLSVMVKPLGAQDSWGDFFSDNVAGSHHLARYVLFFGTLILAVRFLVAVLEADPLYLAEDIKEAMQLYKRLDVEAVAGGYGAAYLLAKVTNGQILTLFGRRRL
jgi:hypothetical protein